MFIIIAERGSLAHMSPFARDDAIAICVIHDRFQIMQRSRIGTAMIQTPYSDHSTTAFRGIRLLDMLVRGARRETFILNGRRSATVLMNPAISARVPRQTDAR